MNGGAMQGSEDMDFLDEIVAERTAVKPNFPNLVDAAFRRRQALHGLGLERQHQQLSQTTVAAAMETSQSAVARLESVAADAKMSTFERFAAVLGYQVEYNLVPLPSASVRNPDSLESAG